MPVLSTISVPGQSNIVADAQPDTLNVVGANGISITTNAITDTLTFAPSYGATQNTICQGNDPRLGGENVSLMSYGAAADGTTDDGPAFQAAFNALQSGSILRVPTGKFRIASAVTCTKAIHIIGDGWEEGPDAANSGGSWIIINTLGFVPFTFTGLDARGSLIENIGVWQSHSWSAGVPADYDYVFKVVDCFGGVEFRNILMTAVNRGIFSLTSGRMLFDKIYADTYTTGIYLENALDTCRITNCHWWPFAGTAVAAMQYKQLNGQAIYLGRADGVFIDSFFALGYRESLTCGGNLTYGSNVTVLLSSFYSDFCKYAVRVLATAAGSRVLAATMFTQHENYIGHASPGSPVSGSCAVMVEGADALVRIGSLSIERCDTSAVRSTATGTNIFIGKLTSNRYSQAATTDPVISLSSPGTSRMSLGASPDFFGERGHLNALQVSPGLATGDPVVLSVEAKDTNADISIVPKGSGRVRVGTFTASVSSLSGYIEVKDQAGNTRKLAVMS